MQGIQVHQQKVTLTSTADHKINSNTLDIAEMVCRTTFECTALSNIKDHDSEEFTALDSGYCCTAYSKFLYQVIPHFTLFENQNLALENI